MSSALRPDWSGRLRGVQSRASALELDALVISNPRNIQYLTGLAASAGLLLVRGDGLQLLVDGRYTLAVRQEQASGRVTACEVVDVARRYDLTLGEILAAHGEIRVGFEAAHVTVATLGAWERVAPAVRWVQTDGVVEGLRRIKDPFEQSVLRRGAERIDSVAAGLEEIVRAGATELEVAAEIDRRIRAAGFSSNAFETIVASGPNSARPHARPTDRRLQAGDLVVLDFGGVLDGYCLDLTRVAAVGPVSQRSLALYDAVLAASQAAIEATKPGIDGSVIDAAARDELERRGFGPAFLHATGHGLGLDVHEAPRIGRADADTPNVIEAGMVFTIEPGAYVEDLGGVRIEDDVLVTDGGCEVLTRASRALLTV